MQGALPIDPTQAPSTLLRLLEAALVGDTGGLEAEALVVAPVTDAQEVRSGCTAVRQGRPYRTWPPHREYCTFPP